MRTKLFYSFLRGIGLAPAWHDHARCPIAQSIAPADQVPGKGLNLPRCSYCALLDRWPAPAPTHRAPRPG